MVECVLSGRVSIGFLFFRSSPVERAVGFGPWACGLDWGKLRCGVELDRDELGVLMLCIRRLVDLGFCLLLLRWLWQ